MLVLSRKKGEHIVIGRNVVVTVVENRGNRVRLGITAPQATPILRQEVLEKRVPNACSSPNADETAAMIAQRIRA